LRTSQLGMSAEDKHDLDLSTEKMKRLINDIQEQYESFIDSNQLYKQRKINEKEFFSSIGDYLVAASSLNFLAIEVIFQLKSVVEKNRVAKNMGPTSATQPYSSVQQDSRITENLASQKSENIREYTLPKPQQSIQDSGLNTLDKEATTNSRNDHKNSRSFKICPTCAKPTPMKSKFCINCGKSQ
jgi:hypothetical protein